MCVLYFMILITAFISFIHVLINYVSHGVLLYLSSVHVTLQM